MPPDDTDGLDDWFENDFGGNERFEAEFGFETGDLAGFSEAFKAGSEDLRFGARAYHQLAPEVLDPFGPPESQWQRLSLEAKRRFRRGWEDYQALSADSVIGELAPYDAMETLVDARHKLPTKPPLPRWIFIGGGFGIIGLLLVVGFFILSGDGDDAGVAEPSEVSVVETAPPSTEAIVEDTEAPAVAVDAPEPSVVVAVADPADFVTITDAAVLVDPNDDTWIEVTLATPWPPTNDVAWSLIVRVGIHLGPQIHIAQWTLHDGTTRGEGNIVGDVTAALDSEMWVTTDGQLVVKLPGTSPTGGLAASDLGPNAELLLFGQLWLEEASEIQQWEESVTVGQITQVADSLPRPDWQPVETDLGPITLIIPDTSDS